ncbi:SGNH/GDSL hydrolase family protein [Chondromyces apiculatus]|uniref:Putative signal peptide protein n=1 Tax=Chondromyces apiculatus DSM 436 TaxID=1192034 RepID=A0A017TFY5_9BACT|nr:SGNH/GDSL hydrolase family protein [Chondromyces apiculatus]EYF08134.1 putative signal peptide protein [Chondromyces apiculatus DSM 436]
MRPPTPARALALALALAGAGLLYVNRVSPDESRTLGALVLAASLAALLTRETPGRRRALEAIAVLLLVLAGGEWAVRRETQRAQADYANSAIQFVDDPVLRYHWKPGISCGAGTTNDRGMLDVPRQTDKPPGTLRIACLGDSVGGDCSLPRDNACVALERILRDARGGRPTEVLNFSVPGYNTLQEARALDVRALPFSPDAAVVLYVVNDPYPELAISHHLPGHLKFEHLLWSAGRFAAAKAFPGRVDPLGGLLQGFYEDPRSWDGVVVAGFDRLRATADAHHLPVVVAVFPLFLPDALPEHRAIGPRVAGEAARHGFIALDLADAAYRDESIEALLKPSRDMIHPNAHAHQLAAEAIARALLAQHPELRDR